MHIRLTHHQNYFPITYRLADRREQGGVDNERAEALKRIKECIRKKESHLDLSNLNLKTLPAAIPSHVTNLCISNNKIERITEELPNSLLSLDASNNNLMEFPGNLPDSINMLDISNNGIDTISGKLPVSLTFLNMSNNRLLELPEDLPDSINTLQVSNCRLSTLPEKLPSDIETLIVENNEIKSLPTIIPSSLTYLDISYNKIRYIDEIYNRMNRHGYLNTSGNCFIKRQEFEKGNLDNIHPYIGVMHGSEEIEQVYYDNTYIDRVLTGHYSKQALDVLKEMAQKTGMPKSGLMPEYNELCGFLDFLEYFSCVANRETNANMYEAIEKAIMLANEDHMFREELLISVNSTIRNCYPRVIHGFIDVKRLLLKNSIGKDPHKTNIEKLFWEESKLNILELIADISFPSELSEWNNIENIEIISHEIIKKNLYIIARSTLFFFLCEYFSCDTGGVSDYEKKSIKKCLDFHKINKYFDMITSNYTLQDMFISSATWLKYAEINYPDVYNRLDAEKHDFLEKNYQVMLEKRLSKRKLDDPSRMNEKSFISKKLCKDIERYHGCLNWDGENINSVVYNNVDYNSTTCNVSLNNICL